MISQQEAMLNLAQAVHDEARKRCLKYLEKVRRYPDPETSHDAEVLSYVAAQLDRAAEDLQEAMENLDRIRKMTP